MRRVQAVASIVWYSISLYQQESFQKEVDLSFWLKITVIECGLQPSVLCRECDGIYGVTIARPEMKEVRQFNDLAEMGLLNLSLGGRKTETGKYGSRKEQGFTSNPFILNVLGFFCPKPYLLSSPLFSLPHLRGCWIIHSSELILQINILLNIAIYKNINLSSHITDTVRPLVWNISAALLPNLYYLHLYKDNYTYDLASRGRRMDLFLLSSGKPIVTSNANIFKPSNLWWNYGILTLPE